MSHIAEDVSRRTSIRIREVIPDFIESEYPQFVEFIEAYYRFLEQADNNPINAPFVSLPGVVTVRSNNSVIVGGNTQFIGANTNTPILTPYTKLRVGGDIFTVQTVASNTSLTIFEIPSRSYFAANYAAKLNPSSRQASGALRELLTYRDIRHTLDEFLVYYRDTYLHELPYGIVDTETMIERVLDFYQSRGSEDAFRFLFRAIFNKSVSISYPRDQVFMASDGQYEIPTVMKFSRSTFVGDPLDLETRQIVGLTSGAKATVLRITESYEGDLAVVTAFIDDILPRVIEGNIVLNTGIPNDDTNRLIVTSYGTPPEGSSTQLYDWYLSLEDSVGTTFVPGETISSLPSNDPIAITTQVLGSVVGFDIVNKGGGYKLGDLVYPPSNTAAGFGFGGIGRIVEFSNTDISSILVDVPGERYYTGLPLIVDNSGTQGGGLAGFVSAITPGRLLLHADNGGPTTIDDGEYLTFEMMDVIDGINTLVEYKATREDINYFEEGVKISDALTPNTPINSGDWSGANALSALYTIGLNDRILDVLSQLDVVPVYIDGVRTNLGGVLEVAVTSSGTGYVTEPTVAVQTPKTPTIDIAGTQNVTDQQMAFVVAEVSAPQVSGQVGRIQVVAGGSGYTNTSTFTVNSVMTSSITGSGLQVKLALGTVSQGIGRFVDTRGQVSADRYIQDITYYQPFSYVLTVEEDVSRYGDVVNRFVHPSGGLFIPRQTITSILPLRANVIADFSLRGIREVSGVDAVLSVPTPTVTLAFPRSIQQVSVNVSSASVQSIADINAASVMVEVSANTATFETSEESTVEFVEVVTGVVAPTVSTGAIALMVDALATNTVAGVANVDIDTYVTMEIMDGTTVIRSEQILSSTLDSWLQITLTEAERDAITSWPPEVVIIKDGLVTTASEVEFIYPA